MGLPDNDRGRPLAEAPSNVVPTDNHQSTDCIRCERCNAPLTAVRSVERGLGPVCCKAVA